MVDGGDGGAAGLNRCHEATDCMPDTGFSRLDAEEDEEGRQLVGTHVRHTSSAVSGSGDETSPLTLSLDGSLPGSDDSHDDSLSTWSPAVEPRRVNSPVVVRTNEAQNGGICRCVGPRCWSYTMVLSVFAVVALTILDVIFIYRQYTDGERFIWSKTMWASVGFSLALCVCCGLCLATHGGTGVISLIVGDKALVDDERIHR